MVSTECDERLGDNGKATTLTAQNHKRQRFFVRAADGCLDSSQKPGARLPLPGNRKRAQYLFTDAVATAGCKATVAHLQP
jgi:hypothetical protein